MYNGCTNQPHPECAAHPRAPASAYSPQFLPRWANHAFVYLFFLLFPPPCVTLFVHLTVPWKMCKPCVCLPLVCFSLTLFVTLFARPFKNHLIAFYINVIEGMDDKDIAEPYNFYKLRWNCISIPLMILSNMSIHGMVNERMNGPLLIGKTDRQFKLKHKISYLHCQVHSARQYEQGVNRPISISIACKTVRKESTWGRIMLQTQGLLICLHYQNLGYEWWFQDRWCFCDG